MPRSSDSVAALASALAKAQAELINPEKSLTATLRTGRPGDGERSFRYAPLCSGLDIVRKTLGQHEIATVQTTTIDPATGMVNLTTMLAHASGEWIASEWPVCPTSETAHPQRMGAALTYARRYALFTLVGIAGEDDLDAPDLADGAVTSSASLMKLASGPDEPPVPRRTPGHGNGRGRQGKTRASLAVSLNAEQSAALRDELLAEVVTLASADHAARWAQEALPAKNCLAAHDAKLVEEAFERRAAELATSSADETNSNEKLSDASPVMSAAPAQDAASPGRPAGTQKVNEAKQSDLAPGPGIDKSVLTLPEPRRYRSPAHLRYIAQQACLICGRKPSDPHHLRYLQPRALGRKVSDEFAIPLCRVHHRAAHRAGDERVWWNKAGIDPVPVARKLWQQAREGNGLDRLEKPSPPALPEPTKT